MWGGWGSDEGAPYRVAVLQPADVWLGLPAGLAGHGVGAADVLLAADDVFHPLGGRWEREEGGERGGWGKEDERSQVRPSQKGIEASSIDSVIFNMAAIHSNHITQQWSTVIILQLLFYVEVYHVALGDRSLQRRILSHLLLKPKAG